MAILSSVSFEISRTSKASNLSHMEGFIEQAVEQNADLVVFPELALTGVPLQPMQTFDPNDAAYQHQVAEPVPEGPSTQRLIELAKKGDIYIIWGMAEQSSERHDVLYNTVVLVGPEGYIGKYRKVHQPLTERLMFYPGTGDYPVYETRFGRLGLMCCFDKAYPEVSRLLALKGAQVLVCPTAWPALEPNEDDSDVKAANVFSFARALENMVFFIDSCMSGEFAMGHSRILGPRPMQVCATTGFEEGLAVANVDIEDEIVHARLFAMGGSDLLKDRKPATYKGLSDPNPYNPISGDIGQIEG